MSGQAAKVKPRPEPLLQDPGGKFRGTYVLGPMVMTREGGVPAPCTRLQHLGDSEVLLETERYPGSTWLSEEDPERISPRTGTPEISSSGARRRPCSFRSPLCYVLR